MGLSESRAPPIPRDHHHILPKKERLQYPLSNKPISDLKLLLSHIMCIYIYIHIIIIYVSYSGGSLLLGQTMYIFCSIYFYICLYISTYFYINSSYFYILLYTSIFFHMFLYIYILCVLTSPMNVSDPAPRCGLRPRVQGCGGLGHGPPKRWKKLGKGDLMVI